MSLNTATGEFDILSFANNFYLFIQIVTIKVTSTYQNSTNSIFSNTISINYVYCVP